MNNNNKAFSLIELSIVLIIIGLLVAGIVGGQSLIENAKIYSFTSQFYDWKKNINTFYSIKGRLPGDPNNLGYIGKKYIYNFSQYDAQSYILSDFTSMPYNNNPISTSVSICVAFWLDLYLVLGKDAFKPIDISGCTPEKSVPVIFNNDMAIREPKTMIFPDNKGNWRPFYKSMNGLYFSFAGIQKGNIDKSHIKPKIFYKIDKKIDDGIYDSGIMRSFCYISGSKHNNYNMPQKYETAINNNYKCYDVYLKFANVL